MTAEPADRDQLLVAALCGDQTALGRLIDQVRPQLFAAALVLVRHHLADKVDPADAVQQGLVSAFERFADFRGETAMEFDAWLTKCVRREALDMVRYWHSQGRDVDREAEGDVLANLADDASTPSVKLDRKERAQRLARLLELLPSDEREAVELRHLDGYTVSEIARRLGSSPRAVARLLKRGARRLVRMWRAMESEPSSGIQRQTTR